MPSSESFRMLAFLFLGAQPIVYARAAESDDPGEVVEEVEGEVEDAGEESADPLD